MRSQSSLLPDLHHCHWPLKAHISAHGFLLEATVETEAFSRADGPLSGRKYAYYRFLGYGLFLRYPSVAYSTIVDRQLDGQGSFGLMENPSFGWAHPRVSKQPVKSATSTLPLEASSQLRPTAKSPSRLRFFLHFTQRISSVNH